MEKQKMEQFFDELLKVGVGGPATDLRQAVRDMMPTGKEESEAFVRVLSRMRQAMEMAYSIAQESNAFTLSQNG